MNINVGALDLPVKRLFVELVKSYHKTKAVLLCLFVVFCRDRRFSGLVRLIFICLCLTLFSFSLVGG